MAQACLLASDILTWKSTCHFWLGLCQDPRTNPEILNPAEVPLIPELSWARIMLEQLYFFPPGHYFHLCPIPEREKPGFVSLPFLEEEGMWAVWEMARWGEKALVQNRGRDHAPISVAAELLTCHYAPMFVTLCDWNYISHLLQSESGFPLSYMFLVLS